MNAVIYARFSSHNQREQSIEGQLRDCHAYARRYDLNVVGEYIDRALSGLTDDRPDFQRMIADAARRQFERIIVWKLDRFTRNRYDSALYKHKLKQYGVRVVSAMENVGEGDESILLEALLEASAEYYSRDLSKKIRRGQRENAAKGRFNGGPVPYGYQVRDGKLAADEKTAPVIRYLFEQYAAGVSMRTILEELTRRGVRGPHGRALTPSTFSRALTNTAYIGEYRYKGEVIPGLAEPLIGRETFERAQQFVKAHARAPAAAKASVEYLLHGKVFCGPCGSPMVGECGRGRNGVVYHYYACANRKKHHACRKANERKDFLEWYVVEQTQQYVLTPPRIQEAARAVVAQYDREFSGSRIEECEKAIRRLDRELDGLVDALIDTPKPARPRIFERMELLEAQKAGLETDLAKLRIAHEIRFTEEEVRAWLRQFCTGDLFDMEFRRRIIDTFINAVYLYDDRVAIFYNIRGGRQVSYIGVASAVEDGPEGSVSDLDGDAPPNRIKSEPYYVFVNGVFGCVFPRRRMDRGRV